jgi:hypothetical protein
MEAWLVACAFSNVPRPAITFYGPQGASKTTTARCIKAITDPSLTGSVDLGKSPADLAQILDHHGVPGFDNLTSIPTWAADMLCHGVAGGAFTKRELYSDDSDVILSFKRSIILTGINIPTHAPDLLDRLLLIELDRIPSNKRMDETRFWSSFNAAMAMLFGALLDAMVGTLRHLPATRLICNRAQRFLCGGLATRDVPSCLKSSAPMSKTFRAYSKRIKEYQTRLGEPSTAPYLGSTRRSPGIEICRIFQTAAKYRRNSGVVM